MARTPSEDVDAGPFDGLFGPCAELAVLTGAGREVCDGALDGGLVAGEEGRDVGRVDLVGALGVAGEEEIQVQE